MHGGKINLNLLKKAKFVKTTNGRKLCWLCNVSTNFKTRC